MISIIIPTYNEEKYIEDCLSQFTAMKLPHEIIVTDDKSKDGTVELARSYGVKVLVPEKKHRTIAQNRNTGARSASGDIFVFIDADTRIADPDAFFEYALDQFTKKPELVGLTSAISTWPEIETFTDKGVYAVFNAVHVLKNNIFRTGEASGKFQMIRRDAFIKVGGYREDLITREDADMFQRLSKIGRTKCDTKLRITQSSRRAHTIGWPKLLWIWNRETLKFALGRQTKLTEWKDYR